MLQRRRRSFTVHLAESTWSLPAKATRFGLLTAPPLTSPDAYPTASPRICPAFISAMTRPKTPKKAAASELRQGGTSPPWEQNVWILSNFIQFLSSSFSKMRKLKIHHTPPPPKDIHMISHKTFRTPTSKLSRGSITSVQTTAEPACSPTISNKWEVDGSGPCRPWNQQELAPLPCWLREMRRTFARLRVSSNLHGLDNVGIEAHVDHHTSHHDDT